MYASHEISLGQALFGQNGRGDPGNGTGGGMGQNIVAGLAVNVDRWADLVQFEIRTNASYLERSIATRVDAGGFVVDTRKWRSRAIPVLKIHKV